MNPQSVERLRYPPEAKLKCLLIHPRFAASGYWNYAELCDLMGVKFSATPLGLMTAAAILPQHWEFRLIDLNVEPCRDEDWQWADLVCVGGKQPQQKSHLAVISEAKGRGKFVVVGGPNPSAQPELFADADCLIVGEGENTIPLWLESWRSGKPSGVFQTAERPDLTQSPTPRFDLIDHNNYLQFNLQYSRGCPYKCDFCDVNSQFGNQRRVKTSGQIVAELQAIFETGYRGSIDIADDNLVSDRQALREEFLPTVIAWSRERGYPFWFSSEVSLDLANDRKLLRLMREADFRIVFTGIETPDEQLLLKAQKKQNVGTPVDERVRIFHRHGICVTAGFIVGFDDEKAGVDRSMIDFVQRANICLARPSLLIALPNTQLTHRLIQEGRMRQEDARLVSDAKDRYDTGFKHEANVVDQTSIGLNFETTRDKEEILEEFKNIIQTLYEPQRYFDRAFRAVQLLRGRQHHQPGPRLMWRYLRTFWKLSIRVGSNPSTRWLYWRNVIRMVPMGISAFDHGLRLMAFYLHLQTYARDAIHFVGRRQIYERAFQAGFSAAGGNADLATRADGDNGGKVIAVPMVEQCCEAGCPLQSASGLGPPDLSSTVSSESCGSTDLDVNNSLPAGGDKRTSTRSSQERVKNA